MKIPTTLRADDVSVAFPLLKEALEELSTINPEYNFHPAEVILQKVAESVKFKQAFIVVDDKNEPKGFVLGFINSSITTKDTWAFIQFFHVTPEQRKKGIGQRLMSFVPVIAGALGANKVISSSMVANEDASTKVYNNLNFRKSEILFTLDTN